MTNNLNHNKIDQDQAKAQIYKLKVENKNTCYLVANRNQMSNNNLLNVRDKNHNISATLNCYPADKSFKLKKRKEMQGHVTALSCRNWPRATFGHTRYECTFV